MKLSFIPGLIAVITIPMIYADNIPVVSSSAVTFLSNGTSTTNDFSSPFTTANFNSAQTGANAAVLSSTPFYTTDPSLTTAGAQWIGTSAGAGNGSTAGYTALFAISFNIADPFVSGALTLNYEVDNDLGDLNQGVYLNGHALPGSTSGCFECFSSFDVLQTYSDADVTADLVQGTNWLYIDAVNLGAEEGLIFSANISTVNSRSVAAVPEPASLILLSTVLLVSAYAARKRFAKGV
jgi:hypothetical protein